MLHTELGGGLVGMSKVINEVVIIVISIISIRMTKASREWREGKGASLARTKKGQPTPSSLFPKKRAPSQRLLLLFQWKFGKIDHVFWNLDHICLFEDSIFVFLRYSIFTHIHKCIIYVSHTYSWGQILVPLVVPEALLLSPNTCLAECLNVKVVITDWCKECGILKGESACQCSKCLFLRIERKFHLYVVQRCTTNTYVVQQYLVQIFDFTRICLSLLLSTSWLSVPRVLIRQSSAPRYFQGVRFYQETFCQRELSESHLNAHHFFRVVLVSWWFPHLHLQELQLPLEILGVLLKNL